MKKFLSLMLAMIMVMSLVTVGAGAADFTDEADIEQVEAVALLSGLGIIGGYDDGSFNPTGSLSRGAAAKIIAWMSLGTAKVEALADKGVTEKSFPDVRLDSSYAVFVEYCKEQGIIGGYDDGNFLPYADLSGHAFIKMALVALGVKDIDFTAKGWQVDAVAEAEEMGLLKGIDTTEVALNLALSRENACQIAFNALGYAKNAKVYYPVLFTKTENNVTTTVEYMQCETQSDAIMYATVLGGAAAGYTIGEKVTVKDDSLGAKNFGIKVVKGTVTANALTDNTLKATETKVEGVKYNFASDLSHLGHEVTVYVNDKPAKAADKNVYAVIDRSKTLDVVIDKTTLPEINAALGATTTTAAVTFAEGFTEWDGDYVGTQKTNIDLVDSGATTKKAKMTGTVIITDKKITGFVKPVNKYLSEVIGIKTDADKETITLKGINLDTNNVEKALDNGKVDTTTNKAVDVVKEYEGIAKGDIVVVTKVGAFYVLEKATTITGKVTKINDTTITVNGVDYKKNANDYVTLTNEIAAGSMNFTDEYTLYLDTTGKYFTATAKTAATNFVYFLEAKPYQALVNNKIETTLYAICVTMDGTVVEYKIDEDQITEGQNGALTFDYSQKGLYKVEVDSKGFYTFDQVTGTDDVITDTDGVAKADLGLTDQQNNNYYYGTDMKFIAISKNQTTDKWETEVRTGKQVVVAQSNLPVIYNVYTNVKNSAGEATKNNTINTAIFEGDFYDNNTLEDVVYAVETKVSTVKVPYVDAKGEAAVGYQHTVYINGVKTTIIVNNDAQNPNDSDYAMNGFYQLTKDGEGYSAAATGDTVLKIADKVTNVYGSYITTAGVTNIDASEAEIVDVTGNSTKVTTLAGLLDKTVALVIDDNKTANDATDDKVVTIYVVKGIDLPANLMD